MGTKGAQRVHKGCTSAGTDAHVGSTVKARVRHVIDRGKGAHGPQGILSLSRCQKVRQRESIRSTVRREGGEESK